MLTQRSTEKEWLDLGPPFYTPEEFAHCQKMLFRVNKLFGFFRSTVQILKKFPHNTSVLDVGCGGGLFLLHLSSRLPDLQLTGMDISPEAIQIAGQELQVWREGHPETNVTFQLQTQPVLALSDNSVDVIMSTLVCHHLTDHEIIEFIAKSVKAARVAVVINDLQRHPLAEFFYQLVSPLLFRNKMITHDGLISIRRSFTRAEWLLLLQAANIKNYELKWCFPFRWRIVIWKK